MESQQKHLSRKYPSPVIWQYPVTPLFRPRLAAASGRLQSELHALRSTGVSISRQWLSSASNSPSNQHKASDDPELRESYSYAASACPPADSAHAPDRRGISRVDRVHTQLPETDLDDANATISEDPRRLRWIARAILMFDHKNHSLRKPFLNILLNGLPKGPPPGPCSDILLVGAGIANLVLAYILKRSGYYVKIVEAQERVGGRIKTLRHCFKDDALYGEAGAMRIPDTHHLVRGLITHLSLPDVVPFYNEYHTPPNVQTEVGTMICVNGVRVLMRDYLQKKNQVIQHSFGVKGRFVEMTADEILKEALKPELRHIRKSKHKDWKERQVKGWCDILKKHGNKSMRDFLLSRPGWDDNVLTYVATMQNLTSRLYLSFIGVLLDLAILVPGTELYEIPGGMSQICESLHQKLQEMQGRDVVQFGERVTHISWEEPHDSARGKPQGSDPSVPIYGVSVTTTSGNQWKADALVVGVPLISMRTISEDPKWNCHMHRAIHTLHYDRATKVFLEFSERFWEWTPDVWQQKLGNEEYRGHSAQGGRVITNKLGRFTYFPSHATVGADGRVSQGGVIIASYTWSDDAAVWDALPSDERYELALNVLKSVFGEKAINNYHTKRGATESWANNPFSIGEASIPAPGQMISFYPHLRDPAYSKKAKTNMVFTNGEHCSMKNAWMEGSIESAIRTAIQIDQRFRPTLWPHQPRGPPEPLDCEAATDSFSPSHSVSNSDLKKSSRIGANNAAKTQRRSDRE